MTAVDIARRLDARQSGKQWLAKCPAHADRSPSLSICEGRNGGTLVRCFAGCELAAIARALGLNMSDFFPERSDNWRSAQVRPKPTPDDIRDELKLEAAAMRREIVRGWHEGTSFHRPCNCEPWDGRLLAGEINAVRRTVSARLGVRLDPIARPLFESHASMGCDRDPAWPAIYERALFVASIEILGQPLDLGALRPPKVVVHRADDIARSNMRDVERATNQKI